MIRSALIDWLRLSRQRDLLRNFVAGLIVFLIATLAFAWLYL